jgi:hypothetical protein
VLSQADAERKMTPLTLLAFLAPWAWYYVVPGPVRFVWHLVSEIAAGVLYSLYKRLVIEGELPSFLPFYLHRGCATTGS